jgi:hypothetical protein
VAPGLQAALDTKPPHVSTIERIGWGGEVQSRSHRQWHVESGSNVGIESRKALRRDTDDGKVDARQAYSAIDDRRVGAELVRPGVVREHDDGIPSNDVVLVGAEPASEQRE